MQAVNQVSLDLHPGEVIGIAGESGSGKSTLAYAACRLLRAPALITGGSIRYQGRRVTEPVDITAACPPATCSDCAGVRSPSSSRAR